MAKIKNYKTGYSFSSRELFDNFDYSKLKLDRESCPKNTKYSTYCRNYANKIFIKAFKMIVDDIIDHNSTFKLPITKEAYLEVYKVDTEKFKKARQRGFFKDIDILKSFFHGIIFQFRYKIKYKWKTKRILLDKKRRKRMINNLYLKKY